MNAIRISLTFLLLMALCSCSQKSEPAANHQTANEPIPAGDLRAGRISFQFAIYYLPKPNKEPLAELDVLLSDKFSQFKRVEKIEGNEQSPTLAARIDNDPHKSYSPPDSQLLQRFGRGLTAEQATAVQETEAAFILDFAYSQEHVWDGLRAALELTNQLAQSTGGLIWDETTRELFSPPAWEERRISNWTEQVPDLSKFTVIHAYQNGEYVRAITLGMEKFGLPDIVIEEFSWSLQRNVGIVINLFAQALGEGAVIQRLGEFDLDLRKIKHPEVREPQIATLKSKATGIALLTLRKGTWEKGDPENRLIEITFDRGTGPDIHAKQEQVILAAFGSEDSVTQIKHDEELKAASLEARTKLPGLRAEFNKGLAPGEFIQVKAPFATPDGNQEWMWVEVTSWKGDKISGLLNNDPFNIPTLHAGQIVEVSESKVFDYLHKHADGTVEGNETAKVIEKQSGRTQ